MAFYNVILIDTDGTELARTDDVKGLQAARQQLASYASDREYRNSGAKRAELYNVKGQLLFATDYRYTQQPAADLVRLIPGPLATPTSEPEAQQLTAGELVRLVDQLVCDPDAPVVVSVVVGDKICCAPLTHYKLVDGVLFLAGPSGQ